MSGLLPKRGEWIFRYKKTSLDLSELAFYQDTLLKAKEKFQERIMDLTDCHFYTDKPTDSTPPSNNVYATFKYNCKRHTPKCDGTWHLLWNPNLTLNHQKLVSALNNHCATWEFKVVCKSIQCWLISELGPDYFELLDDDDTHPYSAYMTNTLNYKFAQNDEEVPDSLPSSLDNLTKI